MGKMKFLLAFALIFTLALSACSGGGADDQGNANQGAYPGLSGTDTGLGNDNTGLGNDNTGLGNSNANSNANGNDNLNGNTNTSGGDLGTGTPTTEGGLGTPAGTAEGGASGTAMATPAGTAVGAAATQTPLGGTTGTAVPSGSEGTAFTNGVLLSHLLGATVSLDTGTASSAGYSNDNANANANGNTNANGNGNTNTGGTTLATATPAAGGTGNTNTSGTNANANANANGNTNTSGTNANTNTDLGMQGGETIGVVDSVIVSQTDCRILYLLVASDADGRLIPVPLSAFFARSQTGTLSQPLTIGSTFTGLWAGAPGWDVSAMPDMTASGWDATYSSYWTGAGTGAGDTNANGNSNGNGNTNTSGGTTLATATPAAGGNTNTGATGGTNANGNANTNANANGNANANANGNTNANANGNTNTTGGAMQPATGAVRITDITNINATNTNGEDLGDINDAIINLSSQKIAYVILGSGGILGIGENQIPVPCELVTWQVDGDNVTAVLNVDQTMLENAPTISELPADFSTGYDTEWSTYWDTTP